MRRPACASPPEPSAPRARHCPAALRAQTPQSLMAAVRAFRLAESSTSQPVTSVDNQHHAVNKTRRIGTNKHCRLFDVGDASKTAERNLLAQTILDRLRDQARHAFRVFDWSRRDPVHANSVTPPLDGKIARQRIYTGFSGRNVNLHWCAEIMEGGANVQYLPAMLFELRKGLTTNVESSFRIDIEDGAETIGRQLFRRAQKVSGGTVHYDVDLAEVFDCLCDCLFNRFGLAHIGHDCERLAAVCVDRVRSRLQVFDLPTGDSDTRARFGKRARNPSGDPRPTAGHKRYTPVQNSVIEDCLTHSFATSIASSSLNFPSYKALPTMTLSTRESPASRSRLMSSRLDTPPEAVTLTFAARAIARVCSMFGPLSIPSRAMSV